MSPVRKILLTDDDPIMRELASAKLREAGYHVDIACNGAEALQHWSYPILICR